MKFKKILRQSYKVSETCYTQRKSQKKMLLQRKYDIKKHFILIFSNFDNFNNLLKEEKFDPYCWVVTLKTINQPG